MDTAASGEAASFANRPPSAQAPAYAQSIAAESVEYADDGTESEDGRVPSRAMPRQPVFAQAGKPAAPTPTGGDEDAAAHSARPADGKPKSDGRSGPLLVYTAHLWLAVFEVQQTQEQVLSIAKELGGYLSQRTNARLVVRVPAAQFDTALQRIEGAGDVVDRQINAQDVSDQFRDLRIRLRNAEEVRDRLAALLDKSDDVEKSLAIERELDRLAERIERLKGQLQSLGNRIAFSTLTIEFGVKPGQQIDDDFALPFPWLGQLGLGGLLEL